MAFPTTSVIDDFNRADEGPPPSSSWTGKVLSTDFDELRVISNVVGHSGGGNRTAWWNVGTFGADSEAYLDLSTYDSANYVGVFCRIQTPNTTSSDGYSFFSASSTTAEFYRHDNNSYTKLGATVTGLSWATGDGLGLEVVGSTLTGYKRTSGTWASVSTRSDSTYTTSGYIGMYVDGATHRVDNFGGGTVVVADDEPVRALLGVGI